MTKTTSQTKKLLKGLNDQLNQSLLEVGLKSQTGMSGCFRFRLPTGQYPLIGTLREDGLYLYRLAVGLTDVIGSETVPLDTPVQEMVSKIKDRHDTLVRCYSIES